MYGGLGSIIDLFGMIFLTNAFSCGPAGPASAIAAISSLLVIIIEALIAKKMLTVIELIAALLGFLGTLVLMIPDPLYKCIFCFRNRGTNIDKN
jgi:drug/metabolite transporter (DMT)-like permease